MTRGCNLPGGLGSRASGARGTASRGSDTGSRVCSHHGSQTHIGRVPCTDPHNTNDDPIADDTAPHLAPIDLVVDIDMYGDYELPSMSEFDDGVVAPQAHRGANMRMNPTHTTLSGDDLFHPLARR